MKQVVKFLSYFFSKTLFLIILTLNIACASNNNYINNVGKVDNLMTNSMYNKNVYMPSGPHTSSSSDLTNVNKYAAQNNMRSGQLQGSNNMTTNQDKLTADQRNASIKYSINFITNQINDIHNVMSGIAQQHQRQVKNNPENQALGSNIKKAFRDFLQPTTTNNTFISSHAFHYILKLFTATTTSRSPYDGFMSDISFTVKDDKLLSELFPNKDKVQHIDIMKKLEELEQKAMHNSITAEEREHMVKLSIAFSNQLIKFIDTFGHRLTIEEGAPEEARDIAENHLDNVDEKLSKLTYKENLEAGDYCYAATSMYQHETGLAKANNSARINERHNQTSSNGSYDQ